MIQASTPHVTDRLAYHEHCGGTILSGDGYAYCATCRAYAYDGEDFPGGGVSARENREAWDRGDERSPDPLHCTAHVTRVTPAGEVYGHETSHCDESGCNGNELHLGLIDGAEEGHVYEIHGCEIVAEIV